MIMHFLTRLVDILVQQAATLLAGTTIFLALGCLGVWLHRAPIKRQRIGELTIAGLLVWIVLASTPLPRPLTVDQVYLFWTQRYVPSQATPIAARDEKRDPGAHIQAIEVESVAMSAPPPSADRLELTPQLPVRAESAVSAAAIKRELIPETGRPFAPVENPEFAAAVGVQTPVVGPRAVLSLAKLRALLSDVWPRLLSGLYVGGLFVSLVWLAFGSWLLHRIARSAEQPDAWLRETFDRLSDANPTRRSRLLISGRYSRAMSFGLWKPTIVLPASLCQPENSGGLIHVLRHELAHVQQRDAWSKLLFNVAFPLLYFHPCYWWLRARVRMSAELIADDRAAAQVSREDYARELIGFVRSCRSPALRPVGATGFLNSTTEFARRMEMLIQRDRPLELSSSRTWRLVSLAGFTILVSAMAAGLGQPVSAQSKATEEVKKVAEGDRLKALERERDQLQAQIKTLELELKVLAATPRSPADRPQTYHKPGNAKAAFPMKEGRRYPTVEKPAAQVLLEPKQKELRIFRLHNANAHPLMVNLLQLFGDDQPAVQFADDPRTNSIVAQGTRDQLLRVEELIKVLDQEGQARSEREMLEKHASPIDARTNNPGKPIGQGVVHTFRLKHASASDVRMMLFNAFADLNNPSGNSPRIMTDGEGDLVIQTTPERMSRIKKMIAQWDRPEFGEHAQLQSTAERRPDLVSLALAFSDTVGQLEIARPNLARLENLVSSNSIPKRTLLEAAEKLQQAERKMRMLRKIVSTLHESAAEDYKEQKARHELGLDVDSRSKMLAAKARLNLLESILAEDPESAGKSESRSQPEPIVPDKMRGSDFRSNKIRPRPDPTLLDDRPLRYSK